MATVDLAEGAASKAKAGNWWIGGGQRAMRRLATTTPSLDLVVGCGGGRRRHRWQRCDHDIKWSNVVHLQSELVAIDLVLGLKK
uniref:Uncharacterized protein n=1 Tax=Oryza nivara TaxID=4536 RepID=A0A0E0I9Y5_ORYNI